MQNPQKCPNSLFSQLAFQRNAEKPMTLPNKPAEDDFFSFKHSAAC